MTYSVDGGNTFLTADEITAQIAAGTISGWDAVTHVHLQQDSVKATDSCQLVMPMQTGAFKDSNGNIGCTGTAYMEAQFKTDQLDAKYNRLNSYTFGPDTVSGTVWKDFGTTTAANDGNGNIDDGEAKVSGATVKLYANDASGASTLAGTTTTAADGTYSFSTNNFKNVSIEITLPDGLKVTKYVASSTDNKFPQDATGDVTITSGVVPATLTGDVSGLDLGTLSTPVSLSGTKTWSDYSNATNARVEPTLTLHNDHETDVPTTGYTPTWTKPATATASPSTTDDWTYTFENLPSQTASGETVTWWVVEDAVSGYAAPTYSNTGDSASTTDKAYDGATITNTLNAQTEDVTVTKSWDDLSNATGSRPTTDEYKASLTLKDGAGNTVASTPTITDNGDSTYTVTYTGLPKYTAAGAMITYDVVETQVSGYDAPAYSNTDTTVTDKALDGATITNKLSTTPTVTLSGTKAWDDFSDAASTRPADVALTLANDKGVTTTGHDITWTGKTGNSWAYSYTGLPKYTDSGQTITWWVTETQASGYDAPAYANAGDNTAVTDKALDGATITNKLSTTPTVTFSATKTWDDFSNADGTRPTADAFKADLTLKDDAGNTVTVTPTISGTGNSWTVSYTGLPKFTDAGATITYSLTEAQVANYDAPDYGTGNTSAADGGTITNKLSTTPTVDFSITKSWSDNSNAEGTRPATSVFASSLTLLKGTGTAVAGITPTVTDNGDNTWAVSYTGLPKYEADGSTISYYATEAAVAGYAAPAYTGESTEHAAPGGTITNTLANPSEVALTGTKAWDDFSNAPGTRPANVELTLANDKNMPTDGYAPTWTNTDSNSWTYTYSHLPKFAPDGSAITWSVTEAQAEGYDAPAYVNTDGTTTGKALNGAVITNKLTTAPTTEFSFTKAWADSSNKVVARPSIDTGLTLTLADDTAAVASTPTFTDNGNDTWTVVYSNLPKFNADGSAIVYRAVETAAANYQAPAYANTGDNAAATDAVYAGGTITNTLNSYDAVTLDPPVAKTITGDTPAEDSTFEFTMKAANATDPMPAGSENGVKTATRSGAGAVEFGAISYNEPGTWTYTIAETNTGVDGYTYSTAVYTMKVAVTYNVATGKLDLQKTCTDASGAAVNAMTFANAYTAPVVPPQDTSNVTLTKTVDSSTTAVGQQLTYTITAKNTGTAAAVGYWAKDYVPDNTSFVSCDAAGTYGCTPGTNKEYVNWFFDSIGAGQTKTMTMTVRVNECQDGTGISNTALGQTTNSTTPPDFTGDPTGSSNQVSSTVSSANAPLASWLPKTGDAAPFAALALIVFVSLGVAAIARRRRDHDDGHINCG